MALRQFIKAARDVKSLNNFIYANLTWLFIALIPIFGLWMKLLYIRRKRYYLEHFVFLLHLFSGVIILAAVTLLIGEVEELKNYALGFIVALVVIFPFLAFKRYYGQSTFKTLIKFILLGIFFLLSFIFTFSLFIVITAALF